MSAVTEFAFVPMIEGANLEEGGKEHQIMMDSFATLTKQPGCQRIHYGKQVENPNTFMMVIDWDSIDNHRAFTQDPAYGPFLEHIGPVLSGPPELNHTQMNPHPPEISHAIGSGKAPATEVVTAYFPVSLSTDDQQTVVDNLVELTTTMKNAGVKGFLGYAGGWVVEELNHDDAPGGKAKAFRGILGWESVEAHLAARKTQVFADNIHLLRQAPNLVGMDVFHINAKTYGSS